VLVAGSVGGQLWVSRLFVVDFAFWQGDSSTTTTNEIVGLHPTILLGCWTKIDGLTDPVGHLAVSFVKKTGEF
jgi:hypothetical protein